MSRIDNLPIPVASGLSVAVADGVITATGPKGNLSRNLLQNVTVAVDNSEVKVSRKDESKISKSNHGLMRTLISNMVVGVSQGFEKKLEINGVGYRAQMQGADLKLNLGFSHD